MLPSLPSSRFLKMTALSVAGFVCAPALFAQQDGAVDSAKLLKELHTVLDQQSGLIKTGQGAAIQQIAGAASSPDKAVALWEEAVRMTQFEGAGHESTAFQAWKAGEGELFKDRVVQSALRLYFTWLQITIQRSSGAKVKDLLPAIISYAKDLATDQAAIAPLEEEMKREEALRRQMEMEAAAGKLLARGPKPKAGNSADVKKLHDTILKRPLPGSIYVQWQRLMEWVNVDKWEATPGNFDGIYENVVLPEMREERDARLLDYWDMMMQKKADEANRTRLAFDVDKYNNLVVPTLLWGKFGDMVILGQKNQAFAGMLSLIKKYPTHPDSKDWVAQLEELLTPPKPPAATTGATDPTSAAPAAAAPGVTVPR